MLRDPAPEHANTRRAQRNGIDLDQRMYDVREPVGLTRGFIHQAAVGMHVTPRGSALNRHACAHTCVLSVVVARVAGWNKTLLFVASAPSGHGRCFLFVYLCAYPHMTSTGE